MADKIILIDTSILIEFYRKTDKSNAVLFALLKQGYTFSVSVITRYEIYSGATQAQMQYWDSVFASISVLPLDEETVNKAVIINTSLKKKRKQIDIADLFIASTALQYNLSFATLNRKHFERIDALDILD